MRRWYAELPAETKLALHDRYPGLTFDEIAILAIEHPDYAALFADFAPWVIRSSDELHQGFLYADESFPQVSVSVENAPAFRDLVVAVMLRDEAAADRGPAPSRSKQGKWEGKAFSRDEVNKVGEIYAMNRDLTPWEVWTRYSRVRNPDDDGNLGKDKVADLLALLGDGTARWDAEGRRVEGLQRSSREPQRVLIPRRQPAP